ncbi:MAG: hypothetical protein RL662_1423 [Bacteroidota bacterium]
MKNIIFSFIRLEYFSDKKQNHTKQTNYLRNKHSNEK